MKNESLKMSKKDLKQMSENLGAIYCGGNVYNYENTIHYINSLYYDENLSKLSEEILLELYYYKFDKNKHYINSNQLAYSCGMYGNSGQLFKHTIYSRSDEKIIGVFYTYYC